MIQYQFVPHETRELSHHLALIPVGCGKVGKVKVARENLYDIGDTFVDEISDFTFNRMYLYLLPAGSNDVGDAVWSSESDTDNIQHIFYQAETAGSYEFWVHQVDELLDDPEVSQSYGLAWWSQASASGTAIGDFNGDGNVNGADLQTWKDGFGTEYDGNDFLVWQRNYEGPAATAIPEPSSALMFSVLGLATLCVRRQGRRRC